MDNFDICLYLGFGNAKQGKMKIKGLLVVAVVIGLSMFTSCKGGYTCPTYMQNSDENQPVMVKENPSEIKSNS